MDYEMARSFADTWGLLFLVAIFVGVVLFMLRPGAREQAKDAASIPFRED